ncbi:hypothetical protein [Arsenophonus sp.]|nr:hypothetical protein [Arsenophonus sp.]MDR5612650.1 hypothetical protein [Arsenophonus sp.]MDR5616380.1 hypothetical protein [Arsenophonus sp.]
MLVFVGNGFITNGQQLAVATIIDDISAIKTTISALQLAIINIDG